MKAIETIIDNGHGVGLIFDETRNRVLDFCFTDVHEADAFLSSAERSGVNLFPGIPHSDLAPVVAIWRDAYKRETANAVVNAE
jgi:hypothetical protein